LFDTSFQASIGIWNGNDLLTIKLITIQKFFYKTMDLNIDKLQEKLFFRSESISNHYMKMYSGLYKQKLKYSVLK